MTKISWDETDKRFFETGLDRGVLYLQNLASGPVWSKNWATSPIPTATEIVTPGAGYNSNYFPTDSTASTVASGNDGPVINGAAVSYRRKTIVTPNVPAGRLAWLFTEQNPDDAVKNSDMLPLQPQPGLMYRICFYRRVNISAFTSFHAVSEAEATWYDSSGNRIYGELCSIFHGDIINNTWQRITGTFGPAPAGAVEVALRETFNESVNVTTGDTSDVAALIITAAETTDVEPADPEYFDGSFPDDANFTYEWEGLPNNSASVKRSKQRAIPWNGLTSIDENGTDAAKSYYIDGRPFLFLPQPKEYSASLKAYTYPDEFSGVMGLAEATDGLYLDSQQGDAFGLSYRTLIGDGLNGTEAAYKIHVVYNVTVAPQSMSWATVGNSISPTEFSWEIQAVPVPIEGYRATAHIVIDTRKMDPAKIAQIEAMLYGDDSTIASLPDPAELLDTLVYGDGIVIIDHGDGTWEAQGSFHNIYLIGDGIFQIDNVNAVDHGDGTYDISSTP